MHTDLKNDFKLLSIEIRSHADSNITLYIDKLHSLIASYSSIDNVEGRLLSFICSCFLSLIETGNSIQLRDFADAIHNLPDIFSENDITPQQFWESYYIPYSEKYNHPFLNQWYAWFYKTSYPMLFSSQACLVSPMLACEFTSAHKNCIENMTYQNKQLVFPNSLWQSKLLGAGEEKAVFAVCDESKNVFALELIDEKHYLNGRLIGGTYFLSTTAKQIHNIKFNTDSVVGLQFTGLVKARDYIRGYEWGKFQSSEAMLHKVYDSLLTFYLQDSFRSDYRTFETYYKDVHERNVMFEITNIKNKGIPIKIKNQNNQSEKVHIRLRGIDLR